MVLFSFILSVAVFANPAHDKDSVVQEARDQILKNNRVMALTSLQKAYREAGGPKLRQDLLKEMDRLSKVFLTEEGQKNFELAESILYSAKSGASERYELALNGEDENLHVLLGLSRSRLTEGNCAAAELALERARKVQPFDSELKLLTYKTVLCAGQTPKAIETDPIAPKELKPYYDLIRLEILYTQKKLKEMEGLIEQMKEVGIPEALYWQFKMHEANPSAALVYAERYVDACKGITTLQRRNFRLEPKLCSRVEEVTGFMSKNEGARL